MTESSRVQKLLGDLRGQKPVPFPQRRGTLEAPTEQGVYVIRWRETVLHVGRTPRAENGLRQRLKDHLYGKSSFTKKYLAGNGARLRRKGYTYQYLVVRRCRWRALLEAYAVGMLCPKHIGLGNREH